MRTSVAIASALAIAALTASAARAEGTDPATAEALFREGRRAAEAGDYTTACPKFEESYRLDPAPGTLLNWGDCEENRGQLARAWQHFQRLYDQLPSWDDRKQLAAARARSLEQRTPKLRIVLATSIPVSVLRDDVLLGVASLGARLPVDPGHHVIVVSSPGRRDRRYETSLVTGDDKELWVSAGEPLPHSTGFASATTTSTLPRERPTIEAGTSQRTAAVVCAGFGAAALASGAVLAGVTISELGAPREVSQYNQLQAFTIATDITIGVGVALLGTAVVLLFTAPHGSGGRSARALPLWAQGRF